MSNRKTYVSKDIAKWIDENYVTLDVCPREHENRIETRVVDVNDLKDFLGIPYEKFEKGVWSPKGVLKDLDKYEHLYTGSYIVDWLDNQRMISMRDVRTRFLPWNWSTIEDREKTFRGER